MEPQDLIASLKVLRAASKSFNAASLLLPWDLRTDLGCLYAFCRVADDLVDDEGEGIEAKSQNLQVIRDIVDTIYATAAGTKAAEKHASTPVSERIRLMLVDLKLSDTIKGDVRAAAASIAPLTRYIPKRLWYEMLDGYGSDLQFEHQDPAKRLRLKTMADLVEYSQCVAGVVGEMCTRVILGRCGVSVALDLQVDRTIALQSKGDGAVKSQHTTTTTLKKLDLASAADLHSLLYEARRMGVSLQLVNIARDIVPDSVDLHRCYLPTDMFDENDEGMQDALLLGNLAMPNSDTASVTDASARTDGKKVFRPEDVRKYAVRLLTISSRLYDQAYPALGQIPNRPARAGLKAACSVYAAIGTKIQAQSEEEIASGRRLA